MRSTRPRERQRNPRPPAALHRPLGYRVWSWPVVGVLLLAAAVLLHLNLLVPHFLPQFFDPAVPVVRVLHGSFGILAVLTALVQIWPGMRRRWPRLHRWNGRAYVFAGVLPCSIMLVGLLFAIGKPTNTASFFWGTVWAATTAIAWWAARRGQFDKHRQWMSYSVALTLVVTTSAGLIVAAPLLAPLVSPAVVLDSVDWLPWVLHLAVAHWYVVRGKSAARGQSEPVAGDPSGERVVIDFARRAGSRRRRPGEDDEAAAA